MGHVDRYAGELLMATGVLHTLVGLRAFRAPLAAIGRDGVVDAVARAPERRLTVWFLLFGLSTIQIGGLTRWVYRHTGTLPAFHGRALLGISGLGVLLMPRSGFWLVLPQAALALVVARDGSRRWCRAGNDGGERSSPSRADVEERLQGVAQIAEHMETVGDLGGSRRLACGGVGVGRRAVAAHHADVGIGAQPRGDVVGVAVGQQCGDAVAL